MSKETEVTIRSLPELLAYCCQRAADNGGVIEKLVPYFTSGSIRILDFTYYRLDSVGIWEDGTEDIWECTRGIWVRRTDEEKGL